MGGVSIDGTGHAKCARGQYTKALVDEEVKKAKAPLREKLNEQREAAKEARETAQANANAMVEKVKDAALTAQKEALEKEAKAVTNPSVKSAGRIANRVVNNARKNHANKDNFFSLTTAARNLYYVELKKAPHETNINAKTHVVKYKEKGAKEAGEHTITLKIRADPKYVNGFCVHFAYRGKEYNVVPNAKIALLVTRVDLAGKKDKMQHAIGKAMQYKATFERLTEEFKAREAKAKNTTVDGVRKLRRAKIKARLEFQIAHAKMRMANAGNKASKHKTALKNVAPDDKFNDFMKFKYKIKRGWGPPEGKKKGERMVEMVEFTANDYKIMRKVRFTNAAKEARDAGDVLQKAVDALRGGMAAARQARAKKNAEREIRKSQRVARKEAREKAKEAKGAKGVKKAKKVETKKVTKKTKVAAESDSGSDSESDSGSDSESDSGSDSESDSGSESELDTDDEGGTQNAQTAQVKEGKAAAAKAEAAADAARAAADAAEKAAGAAKAEAAKKAAEAEKAKKSQARLLKRLSGGQHKKRKRKGTKGKRH